jgi:transposase
MHSAQARAEAIAALYEAPHTGRPSDIGDQDLIKQLLSAIEDGNYLETACHLAGLSHVTVHNWKKRGEAGESPFDVFVKSVKEAEARAEAKMLANVRRASELPQFWAAGMTVLERRHPDRWGKRQDDQQVPRVVVQIGVGQGEVKVGILSGNNAGLSPENINDLACANHSQVEMLSPINRNYVNQPEVAIESVPALESATGSQGDRQIPAVESGRGPYPPSPRAGGQPRRSYFKGRVPAARKKKAPRAQKAQETA